MKTYKLGDHIGYVEHTISGSREVEGVVKDIRRNRYGQICGYTVQPDEKYGVGPAVVDNEKVIELDIMTKPTFATHYVEQRIYDNYLSYTPGRTHFAYDGRRIYVSHDRTWVAMFIGSFWAAVEVQQ